MPRRGAWSYSTGSVSGIRPGARLGGCPRESYVARRVAKSPPRTKPRRRSLRTRSRPGEGRSIRESAPEATADRATPIGVGTALDDLVAGPESLHPGQSAFRLVSEGPEALALRARTALLAGRSLDVQTYIWHADITGTYLAHRILEAADRGVRVRLLVDDMDARARTAGFAGLDAHPSIEVRFFNPFESRKGSVRKVLEVIANFPRLNRRMHNKTWIADNRVAIVGGRNLGDEYFGASDDVNFFDLDFSMVGPVVREASASFDRYWNAPATRSVRDLDPGAVNDEALERVRRLIEARAEDAERSRYASEVRRDDAVERLMAGDWPLDWTDRWRFLSDDPRKVSPKRGEVEPSAVLAHLVELAEGAERDLQVISPYFVPGDIGTDRLTQIARSGTHVRVLTNSLRANDVPWVHGGYSRYRTRLLTHGVKLWELKPLLGTGPRMRASISGASLHTKALTVDGRLLFVGSYNLDPRSTSLNCEQGVIAESSALAGQLESIFERQISGTHAWAVSLRPGRGLEWSDGETVHRSEPDAPVGRRVQAWLARVLPVEAQL